MKNFITIDLETINIKDVLTPIAISIYDGRESWSYNIKDFPHFKDMLYKGLESVIKPKYNGWNVYLHNFSKFDGIFILNVLVSITDQIKPLIRDSEILNLSVNYGSKIQYKWQW